MDENVLLVLLDQWESVYKKALLTFWLLLLLCERSMYVFEMGNELTRICQGSMTADQKSLYRAMRRFEDMGVVDSSWHRSGLGPRRRYYHITPLGTELLRRFARRNLLVLQEPAVAIRLAALLTNSNQSPLYKA